MQKTKIEWADYTWNPVTGCLHGCSYCYARGIARRFGGNSYGDIGIADAQYMDAENIHVIKEAHETVNSGHWRYAPYPFGFDPTFHVYRLGEPQQVKKPQRIFVCSMADLFGEWVPDEWIEEVFIACEAAPQHKYMFLTKNPVKYSELYRKKLFPYSDNIWLGTTVTTPDDTYVWFRDTPYHSFVSIEPILAPFGELIPEFWPEWVIIGAETGNRKDKVIPKREWIDEIVKQCRGAGVPVFMKNSLFDLMGADFVQEWPEGLRAEGSNADVT